MFKKILTSLTLAVMLLALPTLGFAIDLQVGTDLDFTLSRDIELEKLGLDAEYSSQNYNVFVESKVGFLTLKPTAGITCSSADIETAFGDIDLSSGVGFNLGVAAEARVFEGVVDVDLIGDYRFSRVDIDEINLFGVVVSNPIETIVCTHEYEAGVKVSKNLAEYAIPVTPYIGVVYSNLVGEATANLSVIELTESLKAKNNAGLRLGVTGEPIKDLKISIDTKMFDQYAIGGSVSYAF